MDHLPADILIQIGIRLRPQDLECFFSLGSKYNYSHSDLFWSMKCEYEYNYPRNKYFLSQLTNIQKYKALVSSNLIDSFNHNNVDLFSFLMNAPSYDFSDYQMYFDRAICRNNIKLIKILIQDYRVDPNLSILKIEKNYTRDQDGNLIDQLDDDKFIIDEEILDIFIECPRFDPCSQDNFLFKKYMRKPSIIEKLVRYPQIDALLTDEYIIQVMRNINIPHYEYNQNEVCQALFSNRLRNNEALLKKININTVGIYTCIMLTLDLLGEFKFLKENRDKINDRIIQHAIQHNSIVILKYILYELKAEPEWSEILDEETYKWIQNPETYKLILDHPTYKDAHVYIDKIIHATVKPNAKMLELLIKYPEYKEILQSNINLLFVSNKTDLEFIKVLIREFDFAISDKKFINNTLRGSYHRYNFKAKEHNEVLKMALDSNKIDFSLLGRHPLEISVKYYNLGACKALLNSPLIEINNVFVTYDNTLVDILDNYDETPEIAQMIELSKSIFQLKGDQIALSSQLIWYSLKCPEITRLLILDPRITLETEDFSVILNKEDVDTIRVLFLNPQFKTYVESKPESLYDYIGNISNTEVLKLFIECEYFMNNYDMNRWVGLCMKKIDKFKLCLSYPNIRNNLYYDGLIETGTKLGYNDALNEIEVLFIMRKEVLNVQDLLRIVECNKENIAIQVIRDHKIDFSEIKDELLDEAELRCMNKLIEVIERSK